MVRIAVEVEFEALVSLHAQLLDVVGRSRESEDALLIDRCDRVRKRKEEREEK